MVVITFCRDGTVAVFLDESPMPTVFFVASFKAFPVFGFLNGFAVSLAILIDTLKLASIGIVNGYLSVDVSLLEVAVKSIAVFLL